MYNISLTFLQEILYEYLEKIFKKPKVGTVANCRNVNFLNSAFFVFQTYSRIIFLENNIK